MDISNELLGKEAIGDAATALSGDPQFGLSVMDQRDPELCAITAATCTKGTRSFLRGLRTCSTTNGRIKRFGLMGAD
jgi:hypothetical protein